MQVVYFIAGLFRLLYLDFRRMLWISIKYHLQYERSRVSVSSNEYPGITDP